MLVMDMHSKELKEHGNFPQRLLDLAQGQWLASQGINNHM